MLEPQDDFTKRDFQIAMKVFKYIFAIFCGYQVFSHLLQVDSLINVRMAEVETKVEVLEIQLCDLERDVKEFYLKSGLEYTPLNN